MAGETKHRMIEGAVRLLAVRGLEGTSFGEVLELTGAPRGSVYHHFPEGKDQLIADAVDLAGANAITALQARAGDSPHELTAFFLSLWRSVLERSEMRAGCSVLAVTVATDSPDLLQHTATVFRAWRDVLRSLLERGGMRTTDAQRFAALLVASTEGAVVLARAERSMEPFELVAESLLAQLE